LNPIGITKSDTISVAFLFYHVKYFHYFYSMEPRNYLDTYERKETYPVEEVLKHVVPGIKRNFRVDFDGDSIKMHSDRYFTFKYKGCKCVKCNMEGTYFAKERHKFVSTEKYKDTYGQSYHFNLYGIKEGREVMMTKDHIFPKSKGGKDNVENYQPMCIECNAEKKNNVEDVKQ